MKDYIILPPKQHKNIELKLGFEIKKNASN
jgi:hypothetical protein